jgi:hypothetical protein
MCLKTFEDQKSVSAEFFPGIFPTLKLCFICEQQYRISFLLKLFYRYFIDPSSVLLVASRVTRLGERLLWAVILKMTKIDQFFATFFHG